MKATTTTHSTIVKRLSQEQVFMLSVLLVNAGNYFYNLILGRVLGPAAFSDAAILITLLLVLSFAGMTFQIVTAKYAVVLKYNKLFSFKRFIVRLAFAAGLLLGISVIMMADTLQQIFNTQTSVMFTIFGMGLPLYFIMSINRGLYQGQNDLKRLSVTYQTEMLSRLIITLALVLLIPFGTSSVFVAMGIAISLLFGLIPFKSNLVHDAFTFASVEDKADAKPIMTFFMLTGFYELSQIIINNSDILLVKHYFNDVEAGLYASLALIGRMVYFVAWMFVMMLLPKVIKLHKEDADTTRILFKYVSYVTSLSVLIVFATFLFPVTAVKLLFGNEYISVAPLLWKYAVATSIFAVANIFAYYFLSIGKYLPVAISALLGCTQILLIVLYHSSLEQVINVQIIAMLCLLSFQVGYFFYHKLKNRLLNT
ncbi:sugar isomerase [Flavobacterium beibuense F44-8]|uniref:Sugar isomerase n=1 Tax=Flavobacterium beibuense F44-8 TaxID=1406840 RepID=A0A0A2LVT3_9FLAO|nr:oligosaccharide flippase family protein [Flavobacterium beibuense]KGO80245.1 sugar isomerase [Flavobacterium beibuense F44-8]